MTKELCDAVLFGIEVPLPQPCGVTRQCKQAGGCPVCFQPMLAELESKLLFAVEAHCEWSDRLHDELLFGTPRRKPQ
jgi:hypothetical protein